MIALFRKGRIESRDRVSRSERNEIRNQCLDFLLGQIVPVGRHISTALDYLTNQFRFVHPAADIGQIWPSMSSFAAEPLKRQGGFFKSQPIASKNLSACPTHKVLHTVRNKLQLVARNDPADADSP